MYTDLLLLFLILSFSIIGFFRGFTDQLISLVVILSILLVSEPLAQLIKSQLSWSFVSAAPHFVLWAFCAILFLGLGLLARKIFFWRKLPLIRPVDRWLGLGLGTLKGVLILFVLLLAYQALPENQRAGFSELEKDMSRSNMVSASKKFFDWSPLAIVDRLHDIRSKLQDSPQKLEEGTPWDWGFGIDTD